MKRISKCARIAIYIVAIIAFTLFGVNQGIDITDEGYSFANYLSIHSMDGMWKFSTFIASIVGSIIVRLPFAHTLLAINICTGIIKALIPIVMFVFCVQYLEMNPEIAFGAQIMAAAFSWCPSMVLYNYLTYLFLNVATILIIIGLAKKKNLVLFFAGVCLGINLFVRFSNVAEVILIIVVLVDILIEKESFKEGFKRIISCIVGYFAGAGTCFLFVGIKYGFLNYIYSIKQMLSISSSTSDYSIWRMVVVNLPYYLHSLIWVLPTIAILVIGYIVCKKFTSIKVIFYIVYGVINIGLVAFFYKSQMFTFEYYTFNSIFYICVYLIVLIAIEAIGVLVSRKADKNFKILALASLIQILLIPLGSNTGVFSTLNNLFFITTFLIYSLTKVEWKREKVTVWISAFILLCFVFVNGVAFHGSFAYRDGVYGEKRDTRIETIPVLKGMYTSEYKAQKLEEVFEFVTENNLNEMEGIFYFNIPGLSAYMGITPAISTTWPDLDSFSVGAFNLEIEKVEKSNSHPTIFLGKPLNVDLPKEKTLSDYMEKHEYELIFSNDYCYIYR